MQQKKATTAQRLAKLENVSTQAWIMCKMLQKEVGILQKAMNIESDDKEEVDDENE